MKVCWYCLILSILIIVLVWWAPSWANWGVTVLAAIMLLCSLFCGGKCATGKAKPVAPAPPSGGTQ